MEMSSGLQWAKWFKKTIRRFLRTLINWNMTVPARLKKFLVFFKWNKPLAIIGQFYFTITIGTLSSIHTGQHSHKSGLKDNRTRFDSSLIAFPNYCNNRFTKQHVEIHAFFNQSGNMGSLNKMSVICAEGIVIMFITHDINNIRLLLCQRIFREQ